MLATNSIRVIYCPPFISNRNQSLLRHIVFSDETIWESKKDSHTQDFFCSAFFKHDGHAMVNNKSKSKESLAFRLLVDGRRIIEGCIQY